MSTDPDSPQEVSDPEASKQPDQDGKSIDKKSDDVANPPAQEKQNPNASSELIVLSPHYDEKHHGLYVEKLEQAVRNPKVRHIALTGGYGTGKSSVIQGLIEKIHSSKEFKKIRPITISLPTIQIADEFATKNNRTNRIQREIVKQLLYRSNTRKMRGSRYRRITHVTAHQRVITCFIVAAFLTFTFWFLAKPDWHWHWSQGGSLWGYWQPIMVQAILWGLTFYTDWIWVDKPTIKGLELGPTKLELEKNSSGSSYFDQYLNEIIYYFEVSGTNLVIFEDLDRFDNPYIFDALHELNELINISLGQEHFTEQKNPPVKFLYATRDSIFEHETKGETEDDTAKHSHQLEIENRTKFFNVIVPIIPFSTSRNAYEYLKQLLNNSTITIDRKLLEIVGFNISDYRLLANIVSEFQIFAEQICSSWGKNNETANFFEEHANYLFAFVVYKNTHLTDYERMRTGDSNIDKINKRFAEMKSRIHTMSMILFDELDDDFNMMIEEKYKVDSFWCSLIINGKKFDDFSEVELWEEVFQHDLSHNRTTISLVYHDKLTISDNIIDDFGSNIFFDIITNKLSNKESSDKWRNAYDYLELITYIKSINYIDDISSFPHQNHLAHMLPEEMREEIDDISSFPCQSHLAHMLPEEMREEVENFIGELSFSDELTTELMSFGYIDSHFYAYTSIFIEGFNNIKVFNFIINNLEKRQPNIDLLLTEQEASEIIYQLKRVKDNCNNLKGALNVDLMLHLTNDKQLSFILNDAKHLFESASQKDKIIRIKLINEVLKRLLDDWRKGNNYLSDQVNSDDNIEKLLEEIISVYPNIFLECFKDNLTEKQKCSLINLALHTSYLPTTIDIKQYIKNNMQSIISYIKSVNVDMGCYPNEIIMSQIDECLGLNPAITPNYKRIMELMLANEELRNISKEEISAIRSLDDICKKVEFYDQEKHSWIPLRKITKYELECIKHQDRYFFQSSHGSLKRFQDYCLFVPQQDCELVCWPLNSNEGRGALFNMLLASELTGMSEEDIEKVTCLDDIPEDAMFFDFLQDEWYPVRDAMAFKLD